MFFLPAAAVLAGVIVGTGLLAIFWRDIQSAFYRMFEKVKQMFHHNAEGVRVSLTRRNGQMANVLKTYHRDEVGVWHETVARKNVAENEIPKEYLQQALNLRDEESLDMTEQLQLQLA